MHEFARRLEQLLATWPDLSAGHRERLSRSVRQSDTRCWPAVADERFEACLKAALRTAGHELWDQFALQVEAGLVACRAPALQVLALGLCARALVRGASVWFALPGTWAGWSFPATECLVIDPGGAPAEGEAALVVHRYFRNGLATAGQVGGATSGERALDRATAANPRGVPALPTLCLPGAGAQRTHSVRVMFNALEPAGQMTGKATSPAAKGPHVESPREDGQRELRFHLSTIEDDPFSCVAEISRPWGW